MKIVFLFIFFFPILSLAADLSDIKGYKAYSATFSSSGQPTEEQMGFLKEADFERVIYIAFSNSRNAVAAEDAIIKELGMDYVHIPVIWNAPTKADFYTFAEVMNREPDKKTLLHCQVNFRASAFAFLFRVFYEDIPIIQAKADMNTIWQPNKTWTNFIFDILEDRGVSPYCDGCTWDVQENR